MPSRNIRLRSSWLDHVALGGATSLWAFLCLAPSRTGPQTTPSPSTLPSSTWIRGTRMCSLTYTLERFIDYSSARREARGPRAQHGPLLSFLTGRPQAVRIGNATSSTLTLNTGTPQGSVLSPLLCSLFIPDCVATHSSNIIFKFADDIGLITNKDERAY